MDLSFENEYVRKLCEDSSEALAVLGESTADVLFKRLADLAAATYCADLGTLAPSVTSDDRLVICLPPSEWKLEACCAHVKYPPLQEGRIVWARVSSIRILRIYHE